MKLIKINHDNDVIMHLMHAIRILGYYSCHINKVMRKKLDISSPCLLELNLETPKSQQPNMQSGRKEKEYYDISFGN